MSPVLTAGLSTGVGSLPFTDPDRAAAVELDLHPELPAAPQLPKRAPVEGMIAQVLAGTPGVAVREDGEIEVDERRFSRLPNELPLDAGSWAGTVAFLRKCAGRETPIKLQLAGPVTVGVALVEKGVRPDRAFAVSSVAVRSRIHALVAATRHVAPAAPLVVTIDEPSLLRATHPGFPLVPEATVDLLSEALATVTSAGGNVAGIHCCGNVDWSLVLHAGPDLVSVPAGTGLARDAAAIAGFLDRGGCVCWGVIPTDRPIGDRYEAHWHRLNDTWTALTAAGCDPVRLRTQAIVSPACGLAFHGEAQVPMVMAVVRKVGERVEDQAIGARMSVGA